METNKFQNKLMDLQEEVRTQIALDVRRVGNKSDMHAYEYAVNIECLCMQKCANYITYIALTFDYSTILIDENANTYQLDTIGLYEQCIIADYLYNL